MIKSPVARRLFTGALVSGLLGGLVYWYVQRKPPTDPAPTVKELFEERRAQSQETFKSPIGLALQNKAWADVTTLANAPGGATTLARGIRALFVLMEEGKYPIAEQQKMLGILLDATRKQFPPEVPIPPEIANQILRLPSPEARSPGEQILTGWLDSKGTTGHQRSLLALRKLVAHRLNPRPEQVQFLTQSWSQPPGAQGDDTLLIVFDEIRNPKIKSQVLCQLAKDFKKLHRERHTQALQVLVRNLDSCPNALSLVKLMTLHQLKSSDTHSIESGLRSILPIHRSHPLNPSEIERFVKVLTAIPEARRTPFIRAKAEEILKILQP
jgi:hypothetical protein